MSPKLGLKEPMLLLDCFPSSRLVLGLIGGGMKAGIFNCVWLMSLSDVKLRAEMPDIWAGLLMPAMWSGVEEMELQ